MKKVTVTTIFLLAIILALGNEPAAMPQSQGPPGPELLSIAEAEILIYLLPEAHQVRKEGMEVGWEPVINQEDFYTFMVINTKRQNTGSVTIGFFSVNKHTADVWDTDLTERVIDLELRGVQRILRESHHIDARTLSQYGRMSPP